MRCAELPHGRAAGLLDRYGLEPVLIAPGCAVPGSFWGQPEAGLIARRLNYRADTPVHSLLHELAHFVCMDSARRRDLDMDAGGDDDEECAVCYLEILLADRLPPFSRQRCLADMDAWGYSFREASAAAWFCGDGRDAREWLLRHELIDARDQPSWRLRN